MCNPAYYPDGYKTVIVSEDLSQAEYEPGQMKYRWTDDEIKSIRKVLRRLTAIRIMNPNDAEDLVQDTLLTMITKHPGCKLQKGNLVWSMGILRKKVGNYYRRAQRNASLDSGEIDSRQSDQTREVASSPELKIFHEELFEILLQTLPRLPSSQRKAVGLLLAGLAPAEIVKKLQPERYQNVINRLHRGRKKLAKELAKYGYGPYAKKGLIKVNGPGKRRRNVSKMVKGA